MPNYSVVKTSDVPNYSSNGEMRMFRNSLNSKQLALTYRLIPGGYNSAHGHTHTKIDEVVFVFKGTLKIKLDEQVIEVGPKTAVRISPNTKRGYRNDGKEDVEMIVVSLQAVYAGDNDGQPDKDWWN